MANYEAMTRGQTVFLRRLRRMDFTDAQTEPPHLWMPSRETIRRWMENPAFREAYAKARQAMWDEAEACLLLAGAAAAARLTEVGRIASQGEEEDDQANANAGGQVPGNTNHGKKKQVLNDVQRRTLLDLVRVAKTVVKSSFEAEQLVEEQYPRRRSEIHPDGCDHHSGISCEKSEAMLASMAIQRSCWKLGVQLPPEVVQQLEDSAKKAGRRRPLANVPRPPAPGATDGQEGDLVQNGAGREVTV